MLNTQLTSNSLFHDDEEAKKRREQIYVPLALVERKKSEKRQQDKLSAEQASKLYEPQYEEKQRFEHDAFLENILQQGQGKTQGKRIALIGEPGAGKTTLLQTIGNWILEQELGLPVWVSLADLTQSGNLRNFEDYLLNTWLPFSPDKRQKVEDNFTEQFKAGRVWLLLDGVDEIATSGSQTLQNISRQLSGWVGKARVVLTCRLNVWQADVNALSDFETFRLLDFDYPQQVHQFIDNWFNPFERGELNPLLGGVRGGFPNIPLLGGVRGGFHTSHTLPSSRLKEELAKEEKARVRDLVQNPLRLALLCKSWQLYEGSLPETKAELYGQFVEQFYRWKSAFFPIKKSKQRELNLALGRLAKDDIDSSGSRFRLREDFIEKRLGDADDENSLFYLALQIGLLNNVGVAAESPTKKVYAFFHATFEEYFAALAIADRDFFLPRQHKNKPVMGKRYRIFEPPWKQVILLWLGREDVEEEKKEEFIKALTKFKDGCDNFWFPRKIDKGFYEYQAYFLAAAGISEFSNFSKKDQIVKIIVDWSCNNGFEFEEICEASRNVLLETPRKNTINALVQFLESTADDFIRSRAIENLGKIGIGNEKAIDTLVQFLESTADNFTCWQAADSLKEIGIGNEKAIDGLLKLLESTADNFTCWKAAESLGKIDIGNEKAIDGLLKLLESSADGFTHILAAESLEKIDIGNEKAIDGLLKLLESSADEDICRQAAESLGKIDIGNEKAIDGLLKLLESSADEDICRQAAESLGKIDIGNEKAIDGLLKLLESSADGFTHILAAESLEKIDIGNEKAIDGLLKLLESSADEDICRQAAESLGKIDIGNEKAIDGLLKLLESSADDDICRQAAESLRKIGTGNEKAIDSLVKLLDSSADKRIRWQAAESLGQIGMSNEKAIDSLVKLLDSSANNNKYIRWQAAESLGQIDIGNKKAIDSLVKLLDSTANKRIRRQVAASLGQIDIGNEKAIDSLVKLLDSTANKRIRRQVAASLGQIGMGNEKVINSLVKLLDSTADDDIRRQAAESLEKIGTEEEMAKVVTSLKDCLSFIACVISNYRFNECYKIIWKCAQTLPYPKFYQAWHPPFKPKKNRWLFLSLCFFLGVAIVFILALIF